MKNNLLIFFLLSTLFLLGINVYGFEVAAVKYGNIEAYGLALEGFKSVSKANITEYVISSEPKENKVKMRAIKSKSPDLILAIGPDALSLVKEEINDISIIYCMVMYPKRLKVNSKRKNKITGVTMAIPVKDQMLKIRSIMPSLKTLGIVYNPENTADIIEEAREVTESLEINLIAEKVRSEKSVPKAIRKLLDKIDAFWVIADSTVITIHSFEFLLLRTIENKIPLITYSDVFVKAGALLSLSPDYFSIGKQTARLADDIMYKKNILLSPIVKPDEINLTININSARRIGIDIPPEVIDSAKKVFK